MPQYQQLDDVLEEKAEIRNVESGPRDVLLCVAIEGGTISPAHPRSPKSHHETLFRILRINVFQNPDFTTGLCDPAKFLQGGKLIFGFQNTK